VDKTAAKAALVPLSMGAGLADLPAGLHLVGLQVLFLYDEMIKGHRA